MGTDKWPSHGKVPGWSWSDDLYGDQVKAEQME